MEYHLTQDLPMALIAFPKVKDASCPMTNAPDRVDDKQLAELGIEVSPEGETEESENITE